MNVNGRDAAVARILEMAGIPETVGPDIASPLPAVDAASLFIDWEIFWDTDHNEADWLFPDVLARGRSHAFWAQKKNKKSLFMLYVAVQLATGQDPVAVVYLDYEMTYADLQERLEDMGYGRASDFTRFHYAMLPSLPPLDTARGADHLDHHLDQVQARHPDHHLVVVIDTTSRAVAGEENSADTIQDYYRHTGIRLKQRGVTSVRLDHAGKNPEKGQRGSSAKGDDIDIGWQIKLADGGITLEHGGLTRIAWAPPKVEFAEGHTPLRFLRTGNQWPAGTTEVAALLDQLEIPHTVGGNKAFKLLNAAGHGRRRAIVLAATRYRNEHTP